MEVTCPECKKDVEVYVITASGSDKTLVSDKKCRCGYVLTAGTKVSDYD